jgi:hypothetical protein
VDVVFDATGLDANVYNGTLCVESNDADEPQVAVTLTLSVTAATSSTRNSDSAGERSSLPGLRTMALVLPFAIVAAGAGLYRRQRPS